MFWKRNGLKNIQIFPPVVSDLKNPYQLHSCCPVAELNSDYHSVVNRLRIHPAIIRWLYKGTETCCIPQPADRSGSAWPSGSPVRCSSSPGWSGCSPEFAVGREKQKGSEEERPGAEETRLNISIDGWGNGCRGTANVIVYSNFHSLFNYARHEPKSGWLIITTHCVFAGPGL